MGLFSKLLDYSADVSRRRAGMSGSSNSDLMNTAFHGNSRDRVAAKLAMRDRLRSGDNELRGMMENYRKK